MANENKTKATAPEATAPEATAPAAEPFESIDRFDRKVMVTIPRTGLETEGVFVAVNGRKYNVPIGKPVAVPEPVAEALKRKEINMQVMNGYIMQTVGVHEDGTIQL